MDTADLIRIKYTSEQWHIACVHDAVVYLCKPGNDTVRRDDIELVREATTEQRLELLKALAGSSGNGHRPKCARLALEAEGGE